MLLKGLLRLAEEVDGLDAGPGLRHALLALLGAGRISLLSLLVLLLLYYYYYY